MKTATAYELDLGTGKFRLLQQNQIPNAQRSSIFRMFRPKVYRPLNLLAGSACGRFVFCGSTYSKLIYVVSLQQQSVCQVIEVDAHPTCLAVNQNAEILAIGTSKGVVVQNLVTGERQNISKLNSPVSCLSFSQYTLAQDQNVSLQQGVALSFDAHQTLMQTHATQLNNTILQLENRLGQRAYGFLDQQMFEYLAFACENDVVVFIYQLNSKLQLLPALFVDLSMKEVVDMDARN